MMRNLTPYFILAALSLASIPCSYAQQADKQDDKEKQEQVAATGIRFVVSNTSGASLPSTLYYKTSKNEFKPARFSSRVPGPRVPVPASGQLQLWEKNPAPSKVDDDDKESKANRAKELKNIPPPDYVITRPSGIGSKSICIVQPFKRDAAGKKIGLKTLFLNESEIPRRGQYVINLTPYPLIMQTAKKNDFSDVKKVQIKPNQSSSSISSGSMLSLRGAKGEKLNFILSGRIPGDKKEKRIKASALVFSDRQAQVSLVIWNKDSKRFSLVSIQIAEKEENQ